MPLDIPETRELTRIYERWKRDPVIKFGVVKAGSAEDLVYQCNVEFVELVWRQLAGSGAETWEKLVNIITAIIYVEDGRARSGLALDKMLEVRRQTLGKKPGRVSGIFRSNKGQLKVRNRMRIRVPHK